MPFNWNPESERAMLLLVITDADMKPSKVTWQMVASKLGGDLNASAVSQKFYKLKKESEKLINGNGNSAPATPATNKLKAPKTPGSGKSTGRKRKNDSADSNEETPTTKRTTKKKAAPTSAAIAEEEDDDDDDDDNDVKEKVNGEQDEAKVEAGGVENDEKLAEA